MVQWRLPAGEAGIVILAQKQKAELLILDDSTAKNFDII